MDTSRLINKHILTFLIKIAAFGLILFPSLVVADSEKEGASKVFHEIFAGGRAYISGRYRFEYADQDGFSNTARASTFRTRLGFETDTFYGFQGLLEFEDVREIGDDRYNNTFNGRTDFPVVADPESTEVNQAYLSYKGIADTELKLGRHSLSLDNWRFIGDVRWRQNNQTQDGVTFSNTSIKDTRLFYGFSNNINRIFSDESPMGDFSTRLHMFNAKHTGLSWGDFAGYVYLFDNKSAPALSTSSFGGRFDGASEIIDNTKLLYDLEYAHQRDYADNPTDYAVHYYKAESGIHSHGFTVKVGIESLGSDNGEVSFSTPLATLHKFNGWADLFLATPPAGLEDRYAFMSFKVSGVSEWLDGIRLIGVYHDFTAEDGGLDYGTEWDFDITQKIFNDVLIGVRYANYHADGFGVDTERIIFTLGTQFST